MTLRTRQMLVYVQQKSFWKLCRKVCHYAIDYEFLILRGLQRANLLCCDGRAFSFMPSGDTRSLVEVLPGYHGKERRSEKDTLVYKGIQGQAGRHMAPRGFLEEILHGHWPAQCCTPRTKWPSLGGTRDTPGAIDEADVARRRRRTSWVRCGCLFGFGR